MLHCILHCHIRFRDGLAERIEVHADEVNGFYFIVLQCFHMLRDIPAGKKGAVDFRMKGLYASVADFRKSGNVADAGDRKSRLAQKFHSSAGGENLPAECDEFTGEFHYAGLVAYTYQCFHYAVF